MAMTLRLEKDGITGVVKDGRGVVRGLWFTDPDQARDPSTASAAQAYLEVRGAKFEDNDRLIFTAYKIGHFALPIEPLDDGYLVRLPSATDAKIITSARSSTKPWWKFWRTTPVSTCTADVVVNRGIKKDPVPAAGGSEATSEPTIEDTKAAAAKMRPKIVARQIDLLTFTTSAKNIARQFSASRKNKSADAWFADRAYCLLEFGEWVCLLCKSDSEIEPDEDIYYAGLLAGMTGELSDDVLNPLYVRFFKDLAFKPDEERRGHHTLNALYLVAPRLPKIEGLSLDYFRLKTLNRVATFRNLKALSIAGCGTISDFSPLAELASLEVLRLDYTRISDLSPLSKLANLRVLSLIDCALVTNDSMRVLAQGQAKGALGSLKSLRLRGTSITGLTDQTLDDGSPESIFSAIYPSHLPARTTVARESLLRSAEGGLTEKAAALQDATILKSQRTANPAQVTAKQHSSPEQPPQISCPKCQALMLYTAAKCPRCGNRMVKS